ncbi:hypothetical protein CY652_07345 [Burkholderia sp. WAC0059]|uniref:SRPBCC domain-containing protein n=1 Tax=Burkholderia sp. WAC0059 TaxID=2066022 RepID=UPI000C7F2433|nr:SRPBCC domain-containing protein [Burkholderia sp. WAC0059]PLZ03114.1 hypothetical protein CY652_07345 [Burkholderia sp. WAC0059]
MRFLPNPADCLRVAGAGRGARRRPAPVCGMLAALAVSLGMQAEVAHADQVDQDLARRSAQIHWPGSPNPADANVFSYNEITIDTPCSTVWGHLVDATRWPSWYSNSHDVKIVGGASRLGPHTRFTWRTFGVPIDSTVTEYVPDSRLGWFGYGPHVSAYHTWLLLPEGQACHVVTEEATKGPAAVFARRTDPAGLHDGHELWVRRLKARSETPAS